MIGKKKLFVIAILVLLIATNFVILMGNNMNSSSAGNSPEQMVIMYRKAFDRSIVNKEKYLGTPNLKTKIYVTIALKWRNEEILNKTLEMINNPRSPNYHHFYTWKDFQNIYSPSKNIYNSIVRWLEKEGLHVQYTYPLRNSITIYDTMEKIEKVFHTEFGLYKGDGIHLRSVYFAINKPIMLPGNFIPYIAGIDGLNNAARVHLDYYTASSGIDYLTGADVAKMYHVYELYNNSATGAMSNKHIFATGLRVATVLWEGSDSSGNQYAPFNPNAINYYYQHVIPSWIQKLGVMSTMHYYGTLGTVAPGNNTDGGVSTENELDLEMVGTLAPGVDTYCVYGPGNGTSPLESNFPDNEYNYIANTLASNTSATLVAVSNSWGGSDYTSSATTDNDIKALNALGVTVLASSGDDGDTTSPSYPSTDAQSSFGVVAVGGTSPVPNGYDITSLNNEATMGNNTNSTDPRNSEIVWYDSTSTMSNGDHWGTQSGVSSVYAEPWFQKIFIGTYTGRVTADISAMGNRTLIYTSSSSGLQWSGVAGTSVACPVIAGMMAEIAAYIGVNYGISNHGLGYILPSLYQLGYDYYHNGKYSSSPPYFDVTQGSTGGGGSAVTGWDQVSGWGVPNAWELVHDIGFTLSASSSSATVAQGQTAIYNINALFPYMWTCDVGHFTISGLPSGANASTNVSYVTPSGNDSAQSFTLSISTSPSTPTGTYNLTLTGYTYNHNNGKWGNLSNSVQLTLVVNPGNAPDLTITAISTSASTVNEGDVVTIYATVKNVGNETANNVYVGFYYDSISNSTHIGNVSAGSLAPGENANLHIDWGTSGHVGTHIIIAYADPDNIIAEKNENNNTANTTITVNGYGVQLAANSSNKSVQPGESVNYTITVKNIGTLQDTFDLGTSSPSSGWNATLSNTKVNLSAGASTNITLTVSAPSNATNGFLENITVTATSEGNTSKSDSIVTSTTVSVFSITSITIYSHLDAVINFTTSQNVTTYIKYGIGPNHMNMQTPQENTTSKYHEFAIQNLTPQITYYFQIYMSDGSNNAWSQVYHFTLTGKNDLEYTNNSHVLYNWGVYTWAGTQEWQWGTPSNVGPTSAHSGSDLIGTNLTADYHNNDDIGLYTPWIDFSNVSQTAWVNLSFYAWYSIESNYDGLTIFFENESSSMLYPLDPNNNASQYESTAQDSGGNTWYVISGNSNGWVLKYFNTSQINDLKVNRYLLGHRVRFWFDFMSDSSTTYPGFYFDDIQVKAGIPQYHIYGYVKDPSGTAVTGATVWVNDTTLGISYQTTTDSSGRYDVYIYNGINGDNVNVEASSTQGSGSNSSTLANSVEINIALQAVPELNFILLGVMIATAILFLRRRK